MILLKLFYNFLIVGLFSFGGAYSAIPLVRDVAENFVVFSDDFLSDLIAISESTPGPIGVNLATFIGTSVAGIKGAIIATFAEVLPAFIIMIVLSMFFKNLIKNKLIRYVFSIMRPCIIGIVMSAGIYMLCQSVGILIPIYQTKNAKNIIKVVIILLIILVIMRLYSKITNKKLSQIAIIIIGAFFGMAINNFL